MKIGVIDIGGTFIKSGIFSHGTLTQVSETPTPSHKGGPSVVAVAIEILESLAPFDRIGVSTAGQVNCALGSVKYANANIPHYTGTPLKDILFRHFGVPVIVENDVNAAAVGEGIYGAGKGVNDFLCMTLGTGIGCALVINGSLYRGSDFSAGEVGQIITHSEQVPEYNPTSGSYETFASVVALVRKVAPIDSTLTDGRKIFSSINRPEIKKAVDEWIDEILYGLASLIYILNPSKIILGGGIMAAPYILERLRSRLPEVVAEGHLPVELQKATLGNHAGLMGAGYLSMCQS